MSVPSKTVCRLLSSDSRPVDLGLLDTYLLGYRRLYTEATGESIMDGDVDDDPQTPSYARVIVGTVTLLTACKAHQPSTGPTGHDAPGPEVEEFTSQRPSRVGTRGC
jgi:hypothetical protein